MLIEKRSPLAGRFGPGAIVMHGELAVRERLCVVLAGEVSSGTATAWIFRLCGVAVPPSFHVIAPVAMSIR